MKEETNPETIQFSGITFQVINRNQAQEIIGELTDFNDEQIYDVFENTWRFPDFPDNSCFLMAEDDVETDTFLMDYNTEEYPDIFILGFIFKGNLTVQKAISSYDTDNSPAFIVIGKTTVPNITLFGNVHYIGGGLDCDSILGNYNHGELFVKGETNATLVYSEDMPMHFENFRSVQAIINKQRPEISILFKVSDQNGNSSTLENFMPSSHKLSDIVKDTFIEYSEDYYKDVFNSSYYEAFINGISLIDLNKKELYEYANFRTQFIDSITFLEETEDAKKDGFLFIKDDDCKYSFQSFTHDEKIYKEISSELENFDLRMRVLFCVNTNEITVVMEYLDEDGNSKYQFYENEKAAGVVFCAVKYAALEAIEILKASIIDTAIEDSNTNGHGLSLADLKKVIDSKIVQNNETEGINFEIGNAEISINKIGVDSDGNEIGNSIYVSHPDYTLFFKIIEDSPFVLYLEKETEEFRHIKLDSPTEILEFYKEIWIKIVNEIEEFDKDVPKKEKSDKYAFQKIEGEKIEFKDFNFKLAVIQILMYEKELITPKFDLYEFVDLYDKREIDIEEEGYDFIPEVTDYFENLEIDARFAEHVTEVIQDGGDDIYLEMCRFWDGEDDIFNIKSSEDFVNFKNITKVELFYDEDDTLSEELRNRGIQVEN